MDDNVSKIKDKVDVVDLVGSYLKLAKAGMNYKARCPFHNEKSPSFFVSPERQIWHCFGCGAGGDVFGFVKQIEGVEFPEALRILAARAGVELSSFKPNPEFQNAKTRLYEISELAAKFFGKQLYESAAGKTAMTYLRDRGLTDESIIKFRLGYAPDSWDGLSGFLTRNFDPAHVIDAGLAVKKDNGGFYDRFRSRIIFPIFDVYDQVVGFAGRIFGDAPADAAKYVNTPQTPIYDKGKILYGLNFAKLDLRRNNRCLVVEGNMDVILSHQAGATHAVASSGTALTGGHLQIIKRYTDNLDLCFDADSAGTIATERGVDLALSRGFNVGIVAINEPGIKDAADFVKAHGAAWAEFAKKSKPFMEYFFETSRASLDLASALGKKLFSQKLLPFVSSISNSIEKSHWVSEIALALKVKEDTVRAELAAMPSRVTHDDFQDIAMPNGRSSAKNSLDVFEESLLSLLLKKPSLADLLTAETSAYLSPALQSAITRTSDTRDLAIQFASMKADEFWKDIDDAALDREFAQLLHHLKRRSITGTLETLEYEIKEAEKKGDTERLATLVASFAKTSGNL